MDQGPGGSERPRNDGRRHSRPWRSKNARGNGRQRPPPRSFGMPQSSVAGSNLDEVDSPATRITTANSSSEAGQSIPSHSSRNERNVATRPSSHDSTNRHELNPESHHTVPHHSISGRMRNNRYRRGGGRQLPTAAEDENESPHHQSTYEQVNRRDQVQRRQRGRTTNFRFLNESSSNQRNNFEDTEPQGDKNQSGIAEHQLKSNDFECMICCDTIHRSNSIWYCKNCYNIFHLKCAIEWCHKSIRSRNEAIANAQYPSLGQAVSYQNNHTLGYSVQPTLDGYSEHRSERINSVEWPCPTCREVLHSKPGKYKCFCGKVVQPEINRHLTPHSCGQLCGRERPNANCPHACNSICHPGRCAPCTLTSRRACFCQKLTKEVKCSSGTFSCEDMCAKALLCGEHFCKKICHSGPCTTCEETLTTNCYCGQQVVEKRCIEFNATTSKNLNKNFSCQKVCGKLLDCGKHYCTDKCHPGPDCSSCKLLSQNIKTCPCGSTQIKKSLLAERKSCKDPVPTCENRCNRLLICGNEKNRHRCQKKCHIGPCPPCKLKCPARCECKLSTKTIDCSLMYEKVQNEDQVYFRQVEYSYTCETRCNKPKSCGRHRCNNKCCKYIKTSDPTIHRCDQICNKKLLCGLHNCPEICHPGQCGDCTNIGWEELRCHCGSSVLYPPIPCGARPPACHKPCRRAHECGHPVKHECHDSTEKCAPCTVFVKKSCFCGTDSKDSVYCYLPGYSCGRTCKKKLSCKQHFCQRVCHDNDCDIPNERGVRSLCTQPCPVTRYLCKHPCGLTCHGTSTCPSSECKKAVEVTCDCGNKVERTECHKVMKDVDNRNKVAMLSTIATNRFNQDTIMIDLSKKPTTSHAASDIGDINLKKLDCDETCSILKRNKALAEALDIAQPDLKPTSIFGEDPLRLLKEATAQDYKFVAATFDSLARFIKAAKESDKRFIFLQFPPAGKLRREVVHELAHHFNCTSESRDEEPFRHVVVRAYKNKSNVPDFSIEQLLPVSD